MDSYASALSWDGDGSPGTPYIIDGYNITSDGTCIEIRDTVRAFEIRNCYLSSISGSAGTGIQIYNVTQVAIVDTFVLDKPPVIDGPSHVDLDFGDILSTQFTAVDSSGIELWAVNDTATFVIDSSGLLTSITDLPVGEYTVRVTV